VVRGYVVCTTPRSGSNYLGRLLQSTGVLGRPWEFFHRPAIVQSGIKDWPDDPEAQLARIETAGRLAGDIYALKLFPDHLRRAASTRWAERLPGLHFIYLWRRDVLGQAISLVRARQTNEWTKGMQRLQEATYDRAEIERTVRVICADDGLWRAYFAANDIEPVELVYEGVVAYPQAAVDAVCLLLELDQRRGHDPALIDVKIQRDELTEQWRARFLAEVRDINRFPGEASLLGK
jgi:trehalose 2-sulfotransferase